MTRQNPFSYPGSGVYWANHLKVHGNDVKTEILHECGVIEEIETLGLYYSNLWNIVESKDFANLVPETGENSCGMLGKKQTQETKNKISKSLKSVPFTDERRMKISDALMGNVPWNKGKTGVQSHTFEHKAYISEKYKGDQNPFHGKAHTEEFKEHQRLNQQQKVKCPHCDVHGSIRVMKRWHFDKCKELNEQ